MALKDKYLPSEAEPRLQQFWLQHRVYEFEPVSNRPVYSIDTPPATVSGRLHLGHTFSYTHPDLIARFWRMRGHNVYYPMGYDDNGLPTERLVEKTTGLTVQQLGRQAFIERCLQLSEQAEAGYQELWMRLGLSIDWRWRYRTIDERSRRISQKLFIDLARRGLAYRQEAPTLWCPECQTAIAQAELNDLARQTRFITLAFRLEDGSPLPIATTRPELLPACVAIFVHPGDQRFTGLVGARARVPLFEKLVPILSDPAVDPAKGSGAVMCCTFGDATDVAWQRAYNLELIQAIDRQGRMTSAAGRFAGLSAPDARREISEALFEQGLALSSETIEQSIRVHERCDTPVEYILAQEWFVRLLDFKDELLAAGERIRWHPEYMHNRYRAWVENLGWDWCISRQRTFGVPIPAWYCRECGETVFAEEDELPVDPLARQPRQACRCGGRNFEPDADVLDTWATSSLSPQIAGQWMEDDEGHIYGRVFPFSLRPQAHEIIRTWAFYTIVRSLYHFDAFPWREVLISGWGIAGEGMGKISKSRGGGPLPPLEMITRYSADALRYWAASTSPGKDSVISEEKIQAGQRWVTKLWNVARFASRFIEHPAAAFPPDAAAITPADRWILARLQSVIRLATANLETYDYAAALKEIEAFFWRDLADNYLEMAKQRLYESRGPAHQAAAFTLRSVLLTLLKLLAPFLPHITEEIYLGLFAAQEGALSLHRSAWPAVQPQWDDPQAERSGERLVTIASLVRRYKSERSLPLGRALDRLQLCLPLAGDAQYLQEAIPDLQSITRAQEIEVCVSEVMPDEALVADGMGVVIHENAGSQGHGGV
jgi:valyl-tRNA synthetase